MTKEAIERYLAEMKPPEMENNESAPDSSDPLKKSEREALDIYEEEKEDKGSLNNISIKLKDNYYERKLSNVNLEENNSRYKKREKRSNSNNKGTLRALDKRKISSHREGSSLQSELIDIEENLGQVLGRMDVSGNIEARMNRDKVKNVGDKNPLNKYKFSPEASPEKESDQMV